MSIPMTNAGKKSYLPGESFANRLVSSQYFSWVMSTLLHGLVFVGLGVAVFSEQPPPRNTIVPEARLGESLGVPQGPPVVPLRLAEGERVAPVQVSAPLLDRMPLPAITLDDSILVALPGEGIPEVLSALTSHSTSHMTGSGPMSSLFGVAGNAYKVVYVVDATASLMNYLETIIEEMHFSIDALLPTQWFHIVLAKPRKVLEFEPRRLVPGIRRYKQQASEFMAVIKGIPEAGKADPIEAFRRAFAVKPELIYFLTDGYYPGLEDQIVSVLNELNPQRKVKITVIGFARSPLTHPFLERIAREHGGHCRFAELR
ncbi:MAG: hypothetical protein GXY44_13340 [Phycisphaerales bacterium]|nr:hypothetical protein [Phycisphaerales bacterium]